MKKDHITTRLDFIKDLLIKNDVKNLIVEKSDNKIIKSFHPFNEIVRKICDGKLAYIKSGSTGHTFRGKSKNDPNTHLAIKVVAYHNKSKYGEPDDATRPENTELIMIKTLSKFVINYYTPHIVLPILTFDTPIDIFIKLKEKDMVNNKKYVQFAERHKKKEYYENVSILVSEWANCGDFLDFVKKHYEKMSLLHWKVFFFQLISVLAIIQDKYPTFRHNDMKANNLLIQKVEKNNKKILYEINDVKYFVPNVGYNLLLWDFDFACIPGIVDNQKVNAEWTNRINVKPEGNRYYDLHYFFNTFIRKGFFPELMTSKTIDNSIKEFVMRIIPKKYIKDKENISERGRLLVDDEYILPDNVIKYDEFFKEFRR